MSEQPRYFVIFERPVTGRFTVLDSVKREPAVDSQGRPLTGLSHSTADAAMEKLNAGEAVEPNALRINLDCSTCVL